MNKENEYSNMWIWDQVCVTDPAITKHVNQRGGFTAVCAQAQRKRATEIFGTYGDKWGLRNLHFSYIEKNGFPDTIILTAEFFYPNGFGDEASFTIATDDAWKTSDDIYKKMITDTTTKALSMLGFNSDVFESRFDDNKYVEQRKEEEQRKTIRITPDAEDAMQDLVKLSAELEGLTVDQLDQEYYNKVVKRVLGLAQNNKEGATKEFVDNLIGVVQEKIEKKNNPERNDNELG